MRRIRIYTPQSLQPGATWELEPGSAHHLVHVLRLKPGAQLAVFNGDGREYEAQLLTIAKRRATLQLLCQVRTDPEPQLAIHLGLGLSKGERMDFAVQKSVELGVDKITLLPTARCAVRLSRERMDKRLRHWQAIAISACEQSGRCRLPTLSESPSLHEWLLKVDSGSRILLDQRASRSLNQLPPPGRQINLLVGPEGGLSDQEQQLASQHEFTAVSLGPRVLRTETAPLAAIAAVQTLWGDFNPPVDKGAAPAADTAE